MKASGRTERVVRTTPLLPFVVLSLLIAAATGFAASSSPTAELSITFLTAGGASIFCLCLLTWYRTGQSFFMPYPVFLVAAFLYHYGQFIVHEFGYQTGQESISHVMNSFRFPTGTLISVQLAIAVALVALHFGALWGVNNSATKGDFRPPPRDRSDEYRVAALLVGIVLILVSIVPAVVQVRDLLSLRSSVGYAGYWKMDKATGLDNAQAVVAGLLLPGSLLVLAVSRGNKFLVFISFSTVLIVGIGLTVAGVRSQGILPLIGYLWVYQQRVKRIPWQLIAGVAAFLLFVVNPVISYTRSAKLSSLSYDRIVDIYLGTGNPIFALLDETGISSVVVCDTMELVPAQRRYALGADYLAGLLEPLHAIVDFDITGGYDQPALWLVETRYPQRLTAHSYLGYSFIAEEYLEFGWPGIVLISVGFGYLLAKGGRVAIRANSPVSVAMWGCWVSFIILFARGHSAHLLTSGIRYGIAPYFLVIFVNWLLPKARATMSTPSPVIMSRQGQSP